MHENTEERALEKIHNAMKLFFAGKQGSSKTFNDILGITERAMELLEAEDLAHRAKTEVEEMKKELTEKEGNQVAANALLARAFKTFDKL